ncbi:MAG: response regulator, partial [Rhodoferax sp.]|nr:response regulator [Rhodoferax sp.]
PCEMAEDGQIALDMWRAGRYALLLTDCHMPNMDGFELTALIRQEERSHQQGSRLPIIAVTANAMQGQAERCRERGMDDYLSKPLRLNELATMLARWLPSPPVAAKAANATTTFASVEVDRASALKGVVWDAAVLPRVVGNNPAKHQQLLEKFLIGTDEQVKRISGAESIGDLATIGNIAHALKSAARTVGAMQLGDLCEQLEYAGKSADKVLCHSLSQRLDASFEAVNQAIRQALRS